MESTKPIKVCHFTSAHVPGDIRIFHKECRTLAEVGFDVHLVAANAEEKRVDGVMIVSADAPPAGRLSRMLKTSRVVYRKALSLNADVYHFHDPELLPYGLKLKRKGKIVIYDAHEDLPRQVMGKHWINPLLRRFLAWGVECYENYVSRRLDYIITATPHIWKRFEKINRQSKAINNYPLLTELSAEVTDWSAKAQEICYVGSITRVRGIVQLMDALALVPDVRLNLAGKFSDAELEAEIRGHKAWSQVKDYGYVGRAEVLAILQRSRAGIVALLPSPNHTESQPIKMFEYMSAGIPVIGSFFPLWKSILVDNDCGLCVDPEQPSEIADAVRRLLSDSQKSEEMGQNGRRAVMDRFNWTAEGAEMVAIYRELLR